jgi:transcription elongation GreA/GreB family factor
MSRAFTKEVDDAPVPPPPERPVSASPNLVTPRGARLIEQQLAEIESQLQAIVDPAGRAALLRDQRYWAARRASMQVVVQPDKADSVRFGVSVTIVRSGKPVELTIVGEDEANPSVGLLAWTSPLAIALEGAEPGELFEFQAGPRSETVEVVSVKPAGDRPL